MVREGTRMEPVAGGDPWARPFVCAVMAALLAPVALMPLAPAGAASEKRELAGAPSPLLDDGSPNLGLLADAGAYLEDHFAFRAELVDADATVRERVFAQSSVSEVIVGEGGWLYYEGELNDWWRRETLSEAGIESAALNLALVQEGLGSRGKAFALGVAPNKSTLYPGHMPYYYVRGEGPSAWERLLPRLRELGVNVADLEGELAGREGAYYLRDSHWNEEGALAAYGALCRALGREPRASWGDADGVDAHVGDLDAMLHPAGAEPERQAHRTALDGYEVLNGAGGVEDPYVVTSSTAEGARGTLLAYRDSFGNALLAPLACSYRQAVFTKGVPYNLTDEQVGFADDVIIERAERHIASFATSTPFMDAPERQLAPPDPGTDGAGATLFREEAAGRLLVEGSLDRDLRRGEHVYVGVVLEGGGLRCYEAFRVSAERASAQDFEGQGEAASGRIVGDGGYRAYVPLGEASIEDVGDIRVFVGTQESCREVTVLSADNDT